MSMITNRSELRRIIDGYQLARCVQVAAELGLADLLKDGGRSSDELAALTGTQPQALFRLMRALASAGIFVQQESRSFALNEPARLLISDGDGSLRALAMLAGQQHYPSWGHLMHSITTGDAAFDDLHGQNVWQFRSEHPEAGRVFDQAMQANTAASVQAVVKAYHFAHAQHVVDVGGGSGVLMTAVLAGNPSLRGTLFDRAQAIPRGIKQLAEAGLLDRCAAIAGDFFEFVPPGGDLYLLQRVLHDWDDDTAAQILANCRRAMQTSHSLVLIERVLPTGTPPLEAALIDLTMLVVNGGRERTESEFRALLELAGFRLTAITPTDSGLSLIQASAV
jgi:hypothetical protein